MRSPSFGSAVGGFLGNGPQAPQRATGLWEQSPTNVARLASSSAVKTGTPFTGSHARQYSKAQANYGGFGGGAGNQSLNAFSRASAMQQSAAANQTLNDLDRTYQNKAQQVRAGDVYNQRADQVRRFGMQESNRADLRGQDVNREQSLANFETSREIARKNAENNLLSNTLGLVAGGGLLSGLATVGTLRAALPESLYGLGMGMRAFPGWNYRPGPVGRSLSG